MNEGFVKFKEFINRIYDLGIWNSNRIERKIEYLECLILIKGLKHKCGSLGLDLVPMEVQLDQIIITRKQT